MNERMRRWIWPLVKALLALAIVGAVGWQFWGDLHHAQLQQLSLQMPWVVLSALLYLAGLGCAAWYWYRLLVVFGERPALGAALRAY